MAQRQVVVGRNGADRGHLRSGLVGAAPPRSGPVALGQTGGFFGGLASILLALASPVDPLAALLLQAHMVQHLLLMMVAPPLVWLGDPLFPIIRGLPRTVRKDWIIPLMRAEGLRQALAWLTYPPVALAVYVVVTWCGHVPAVYETALRSDVWHVVQHVSFLAAALLFWYPVIRPYPSHPSWSLWLLIPYLVLADVQNTMLAALITFSRHVLYPYYDQVPRLAGLSALDDQAAAGVAMWVPGSVAFLLPLFVLGVRLIGGADSAESNRRAPARSGTAPPPCRRLASAAGRLPIIERPAKTTSQGGRPAANAGGRSAARGPSHPPSAAGAVGIASRRAGRRRMVWAADRSHESGWRATVDPLAWRGGLRPVGRRQSGLRSLPVHFAAESAGPLGCRQAIAGRHGFRANG